MSEIMPIHLPNALGAGQLFAYSGMEGDTDWYHPFICSTLGRQVGLEVRVPENLSFWIAARMRGVLADGTPGHPFLDVAPRLVSSDWIDVRVSLSGGQHLRVEYLALDARSLAGIVTLEGRAAFAEIYVVFQGRGKRPVAQRGRVRYGSIIARGDGWPVILGTYVGADAVVFKLNLVSGGRRPSEARFVVARSDDGSEPALPETAQLDHLRDRRMRFFSGLPAPPTRDASLLHTYAKACSVLKVNVESPQGEIPVRWTTPDRHPHRNLWLWDSAFHTFGYRYLDPGLARDALLAVLSKEREDGFIPHMMAPERSLDSSIIQPPLLAWAARSLHAFAPDKEFLRTIYPKLVRYLEWDLANRDADHSGLLEWADPRESGADNSPRFDGNLCGDAIDFNAFIANEMDALARIALALGRPEEARTWRRRRRSLIARINERLWDPEDGIYYDRAKSGELLRVKTVMGLLPLALGLCDEPQAARLVGYLTNPDSFWRALPVPTVSATEPSYSKDMWRGPTWLNYNYLIYQGLRHYRYSHLADQLREITLRQVAQWYRRTGCLWEFYDADAQTSPADLPRKGYGGYRVVADYNWTAALFVALLMEPLTGENRTPAEE